VAKLRSSFLEKKNREGSGDRGMGGGGGGEGGEGSAS